MGLMVFARLGFGRSNQGITLRSCRRVVLHLLLGGGLLLTAIACQKPPTPPETPVEPNPENRLIVEDALLEQSDENGKILWKLQAEEAIYSQDRKVATLKNLVGNLYEDGKVILSLQAKGGRVINDGEKIFLENDVLVTDNRQGIVFEAKQVEWEPSKSLLQITQPFSAKYPNGKLIAKLGKYFIDRQELELTEAVEIVTVKPSLRLQGKKLLWQVKENKIIGEQGLTVQSYTKDKITARFQADKGEALIKTEIVTVRGNVLLNSLDPEVQFTSGEAVWNLKSGVVAGKNSVQITHNKEKVQFRGSQGTFNLNTKQATLTGAVNGTGENPPASLSTNQLDWNLVTEVLTAQGNVVYQQANPFVKLNGDRAVGKLNQNQLVISGTQGKQVTTEIIPQ